MQTVGMARSWAIQELKQAGIQSPALAADLLLGFVLAWDRTRVLSHTEQTVFEEFRIRFEHAVLRHAAGEPLHYLTGEREFYGLAFRVTPAVLIPRPETEILVEKAIEIIKGLGFHRTRFADVGTGTGCIAVAVACHIPSSTGLAIDISAAALDIARENAIRHGVADRIQFVQADLLSCFRAHPHFDFILSNPPYVALEEYDNLPAAVRNYEPHAALFGGASGMDIYHRLIPEASPRLKPEGYLLLESGAGQAERIGSIIEKEGLSLQMTLNDLQGIPRCLVGLKPPRSNNG
jgi:release factor glutamine methyltransferase